MARSYSLNKCGAQGAGSLIVFVSLILVAGMVAGVLTTTATNFQSEALDVNRQTSEKLTKGLEIVQVTASDVSDGVINGSSDEIVISTRLSLGSDSLKIEDILVTLDTQSISQVYEVYSGNVLNSNMFIIEYISNGGIFQNDGYIVSGDLVNIIIRSPVDILEEESFKVGFTGPTMITTTIDITTPSAMAVNTMRMYP